MASLAAHGTCIGSIKAETEHGTRYGVTFSRLYRDGDQWKSSDSFSRDDLLVLAKVADRVHSWIVDRDR